MSSQMVRKQFYISKRQDLLLKHLSQRRGLSEAEIVRQAIEREASGVSSLPASRDMSAMDEFRQLALERRSAGIAGEPYRWNRQEIYEERENRWFRDKGKE